jgi:AcrR family transcriptional regulator
VSGRRSYDSPVRRERAAETRERIVAAGSELVHQFDSWEWDRLTFRAVAAQASVGERTVYRHFPTERHLHQAVMHRLHQEAGVDYDTVTLSNVAEVTARVLDSLGSFPTAPTTTLPTDSIFGEVDERRRAALHRVVAELDVDGEAREAIAAVLDVLWNLPAYERMVRDWNVAPERASATLSWLVELVLRAADAGEVPPDR